MPNFNLENYIPVNERLALFYKDYPNGRILTELVEHNLDTGFVMFKASAFRETDDAQPSATGHAFEERTQGYVNKTSYIENCETSSVGRALALLGYEITKSIASREEMEKVKRYSDDGNGASKPQTVHQTANGSHNALAATVKPAALPPKRETSPVQNQSVTNPLAPPQAIMRRKAKVQQIFDCCKRLKLAGDLSLESTGKLNDYINEKWETAGGIDSLDFALLDDLYDELEERAVLAGQNPQAAF